MKTKIRTWYEKNLPKLWIIPLIIAIIALSYLAVHTAQYGEVFKRDISLRGGIVATLDLADVPNEYSSTNVEGDLEQAFPGISFDTTSITAQSNQVGLIIESTFETSEDRENLIAYIQENFGLTLDEITVEQTESSFGASFFYNLIGGVLISFLLMAVVVYLTFRKWYPSGLVILAVLSDIIITLSFVTFFGIKVSGAGIAAFLMIIGYAVDTNILLSYRVLRVHDKTVMERIIDASKTGLLMSGTTFAAMLAALLVTNSAVIFQILLILTVALFVDMINTWFLNANLLRIYVEKQEASELNKKGRKKHGKK